MVSRGDVKRVMAREVAILCASNRGDVKRVIAREVTILCARAFICIKKCYKKRGLHLCGQSWSFVRVTFVFYLSENGHMVGPYM